MAQIFPFKAVRPSKEYADIIPALPYDVYSRAEAKAEVSKHPHSFLAIDRPETNFDDNNFDMYSDEAYEKAASMLKAWKEEGSFVTDEEPHYYVYELTMCGRSQTGIVGCASIDDYLNGVIKKHENTRRDKEEDRVRHVYTCSAQTGPIFLAYRGDAKLKLAIQEIKKEDSLYDVTGDDGIRHRVWIVTDEADTELIKKTFENMDSIYIADGHHRCASAVRVGLMKREENPSYDGSEEFNMFMAVLFPDEELSILDYNRVVNDLNGLDQMVFMSEISKHFSIGDPSYKAIKPTKKGEISMYLKGLWYPLTIKDNAVSDDPVEGLDVAILQKYVLDEILDIKDPTTDKRISFVGGIRGLAELEKNVAAGAAVAFAMYPTSIDELFRVADAGLLMPPKSTWFEPKLKSGFFIHEF